MRAEEQFDSFYLKSRRALVLQTFALTGDLAAAQRAVRDAYVGAWHHWRKVEAYDDPRDWVRPRAWSLAQRRHTARLWQRTKDLSPDDRAVLDALHKLSGSERRALLIVQLAGVPLDVAARELNVTQATLERQLQAATARFAAELGTDSSTVRGRLVALGDTAARAALPRPAAVRREGRNRRRTHTLVATAVATFLAVGSGAVAHEPADDPAAAGPVAEPEATESSAPPVEPPPESSLPSADDLLGVAQVRRLAPGAAWKVADTHDNTEGEGINYLCQQERFADPAGLATLVRTLRSDSPAARELVQAVEISESSSEAAATYDRVQTWFAGCEGGEVQLQRTFRVKGVADRAVLMRFRSWSTPASYAVTLAQVGQVTTTTVVRSTGGQSSGPNRVAATVAASTRMLCERAGDTCASRPRLAETRPPASTEAVGALATVDLPPLPGIKQPWSGTRSLPAPREPAITCDRASFRRMGAERARTRIFLVPTANLPDRFGLTGTYGTFRTARGAAAFLGTIRDRMASCEDDDLATEVEAPQSLRAGPLDGSTWRLRTGTSETSEVVFDIGFVRRGRHVAQVTFVPAGRADLGAGDFRELVIRAGQRLAELD